MASPKGRGIWRVFRQRYCMKRKQSSIQNVQCPAALKLVVGGDSCPEFTPVEDVTHIWGNDS